MLFMNANSFVPYFCWSQNAIQSSVAAGPFEPKDCASYYTLRVIGIFHAESSDLSYNKYSYKSMEFSFGLLVRL